MALDTSIYGNIKQPETPDFMGSIQKGMALSQLALQNRQLQQGAADNDAVRTAFSKNVGPDGQINRQGVLSDLAKTAPMQAMDYQSKFAQQDVAQAEAKQKMLGDKINQMGMAAQMAMSAKDQPSYDGMLKQMQGMGMDTSHMPPQFDPTHMKALALASLDQKQRLEAMAKTSEMDINQAKAPLERGKIVAETDKLRSETPRSIDFSKVTPDTDPATLVAHAVPKDRQKDAFEEIKKAQDVRKIAPSIIEAFDMANSRNPNEAKKGRDKFEGLINTTIVDLTGTARQAEFDNIHKTMTPSGMLARPGENENKRDAVLKYLAAKSSAPVAKGYGIDLSKFNSSAPYDPGPGEKKGGWLAGGVKSANAASMPKPGAVDDGFVYMGGDPADQKSWKKAR